MIIDIWGIKTTRTKGVLKRLYCFLADKEHVLKTKKKGYIVRYTCDCVDCFYPNKINTTTTSVLLNDRWNNVNSQMCRSCRTRKSERDIKKTIIPFDVIRKSVESEGYKILTTKSEYDNGLYPSQFRISVICKNGHKYHITWNNWSKGKRCRKCYTENRWNNSASSKKGFFRYEFNVNTITEITYKKYKDVINPSNIKRGRKFHLDHKYSISQGYKDNINSKIIGSYVNLEIISAYDNCSKQEKCSITKEELLNEYKIYIGGH